MSTASALIIDDERDIRELLSITLGRMGLKVDTASDVAEARQRLAESRYALCFTDMRLPDGSGQEIVELIAEKYPETPVAMITAHGNVDAAVTALKAGAFDFVSKPVDISMLRRLVQTALRLAEEKKAEPQGGASSRMLGDSPAIKELRADDRQARSQSGPCLYQRRIRRRQGTRCSLDPRTRTTCGRSVCPGQLRCDSERTDGVGILRPQARQLHRRSDRQGWFVPGGEWRNVVSRRSRGASLAHAGKAAARDPGKGRAPDRRPGRSTD